MAFDLIVQPHGEMGERLRPGVVSEKEDHLSWLRDLYERHSDYVRAVVASHAGPGLDVEDMVQEVFIAAHRKSARLIRYGEPRGWLHLAALREVWKVRHRSRLAGLFRFRLEPPPSSESPEAVYQSHEQSAVLYTLLDKLPTKQRAALILFHVEGLSSAEISHLLRCPEPTVRTRLFHARRSFAAAFDRWKRSTSQEPDGPSGKQP